MSRWDCGLSWGDIEAKENELVQACEGSGRTRICPAATKQAKQLTYRISWAASHDISFV